eukprot:5266844-Ditylum_brightwellii.AAC.1
MITQAITQTIRATQATQATQEAKPSWDEKIKKSFEGRTYKETNIDQFFMKKRGQKTNFEKEQ